MKILVCFQSKQPVAVHFIPLPSVYNSLGDLKFLPYKSQERSIKQRYPNGHTSELWRVKQCLYWKNETRLFSCCIDTLNSDFSLRMICWWLLVHLCVIHASGCLYIIAHQSIVILYKELPDFFGSWFLTKEKVRRSTISWYFYFGCGHFCWLSTFDAWQLIVLFSNLFINLLPFTLPF